MQSDQKEKSCLSQSVSFLKLIQFQLTTFRDNLISRLWLKQYNYKLQGGEIKLHSEMPLSRCSSGLLNFIRDTVLIPFDVNLYYTFVYSNSKQYECLNTSVNKLASMLLINDPYQTINTVQLWPGRWIGSWFLLPNL